MVFCSFNPIYVDDLKGQCHEIFCFWLFSWISFPQASDYTIRVVTNFFENSLRNSQLKVCHRCRWHRRQMEKTFKLQNFNNFVWTPLGSRVNIYINFCLQVHFKGTVSRDFDFWFFSWISFPQSPEYTMRAVSIFFENSRRYLKLRFATGVVDTGGKCKKSSIIKVLII